MSGASGMSGASPIHPGPTALLGGLYDTGAPGAPSQVLAGLFQAMVLTPSSMVALGHPAPDFSLPNTEWRSVSRADFAGKPLLVMFMCNHCPYVKHLADELGGVARAIGQMGIGVVGINSNDAQTFPDDSPAAMVREKAARGWDFEYLFDGSQEVARAYDAQCTPDFFLYNSGHVLVYRGQFDPSRPGNGVAVTGESILAAARAVTGAGTMPAQVPSIGCNIKWKVSA
jgi:peroxiredoxin